MIAILGANSAVGRELCRELAGRGKGLLIASRDESDLARNAADLQTRFGTNVIEIGFDVVRTETHAEFVRMCLQKAPGLEGVIVCVGELGNPAEAERDSASAKRILDTNLTGVISLMNLFARHFSSRRSGYLCALSSVAGERGRSGNFVYGSAKAGLTAFLSGLRQRVFADGVRVITIKLGPVDTRMTYGSRNLPFLISPSTAATAILAAIDSNRNIVFVPWIWRPIMALVRTIPESIFKRMKL